MGTSLAWRTDNQMHDAVRRQLDEDPLIEARGLAVRASGGVITLTGFVDTYAQKLAAEQSVKRVRGVHAIANDVEVRPPDGRTDPEIAVDALRALHMSTDLADRVTVTVRHGFVTLEGDVDSTYQKEAAQSAVKDLNGVRGVSNLIQFQGLPSTVLQ